MTNYNNLLITLRNRYVPLISSLMAPQARYMLVIDTYDKNVIQGKTQNNQYAAVFVYQYANSEAL